MPSHFAHHLGQHTSIWQIMDDLATDGQDYCMLGGGNPAHIPAVQQRLQQELQSLSADPLWCAQLLGDYDHPQGNHDFIDALTTLFNQTYGWNIGRENIALGMGSQYLFFVLFNLLAGEQMTGEPRHLLLPALPDYVGYNNLLLATDLLSTCDCRVAITGEREFKYQLDEDRLDNITVPLGAICVSRPTNPSGNVLDDVEMQKLHTFACERDIPLIVDNAYGIPFPNIMNIPIKQLPWDEHIIYCMSLSKLGLPGVRTGIVVAKEDIIRKLVQVNAVIHLANSNLGAMLLNRMTRNGELIRLANECIQPFYQSRMQVALDSLHNALHGVNYFVHRPEGGLFLWLYLPELPISDATLYQRLKKRGVLVIPGHYFFAAGDDNSNNPHYHRCLRLSYAGSEEKFATAMQILAEELHALA